TPPPTSVISPLSLPDALPIFILYRMGQPAGGVKTQLISALDPLYPAASTLLNKELSKILAFLEAPGVIEKTLALLEKAESGEDTDRKSTRLNSSHVKISYAVF